MKLHMHNHTRKTTDRMHIHKCAFVFVQQLRSKRQDLEITDNHDWIEELILGFLVSEIQIIHLNINLIAKLVAT